MDTQHAARMRANSAGAGRKRKHAGGAASSSKQQRRRRSGGAKAAKKRRRNELKEAPQLQQAAAAAVVVVQEPVNLDEVDLNGEDSPPLPPPPPPQQQQQQQQQQVEEEEDVAVAELEPGQEHASPEEEYEPELDPDDVYQPPQKQHSSKARTSSFTFAGGHPHKHHHHHHHRSKTLVEGRARRTPRRRRDFLNVDISDLNLSEDLLKCYDILSDLMNHPGAAPFNQPVDPIMLHIPDYFDVIKHPMDFSTIMEQLKSGVYHAPQEFYRHVRLVFGNAMRYNPLGHPIHTTAAAMLASFEARYRNMSAEIAQDQIDKKHMYENTLKQMQESVLLISSEIIRLKQCQEEEARVEAEAEAEAKAAAPEDAGDSGSSGSAVAAESNPGSAPPAQKVEGASPPGVGPARPTRAASAAAAHRTPARPMNYDEKRRLSARINGLPPDKLATVVMIIQDQIPALRRHTTALELEIDLDALDHDTLRKLERFVRGRVQPSSGHKPRSRGKVVAPPALASPTAEAVGAPAADRSVSVSVSDSSSESSSSSSEDEGPGGRGGAASSESSSSDSDTDALLLPKVPATVTPEPTVAQPQASGGPEKLLP
eukprot:TRINITY_DN1670_c0_g1_i1.p1 TRINITY_DN1670_c0_g1~~TRINITY_DN1670_c0_g1_i1.p1  ORF type:complete len:605 (-),score=176.24 TRINITY_DN1670_c0_g1_i1:62-1852(-)